MEDDRADPPFRDLTVRAFVDLLGSVSPVPGGGSASAVTASLGGALVAMVASLSEGRPRYAEHASLHTAAMATGRRLADRLLEIAEDDSAAYTAFGAAIKLPRETPDEQAARTTAMQAAARGAAEVPLRCMEACLEVLTAAEELAGRSNVNAASDLDVAALLAEAAARGAALNVRTNLPSVGDETYASATGQRVDELLADIVRIADRVHEVVASNVARPPISARTLA